MKTVFFSFSILFFLFYSSDLFSQEFGDVTDEELSMISIDEDPEADVVILINKSRMIITPDFDLDIERHVRIKILTETGKEWANISIPYWHEDKIFGIEAQSYLPNGDEFELDDDDIFEEELPKTKYYKFAIPGVEVGSVIEYKYSHFSEYISNLEPWYFQSKEFTKLSQISILLPKGFNYSSLGKNWAYYDINKEQTTVWNPYQSGKKIVKYTWTGRNLPAIRKEPYMHTFKDYYAQILFQLVSFKNQYFSHTYAKTWNDIAENNFNVFKNAINASGDQTDFIDTSLGELFSPLEKALKIYNFVQSEIETEFGGGWYPRKEPEDVFEDKKGTPSEKNTLLMNMLNHLGIKAEPVLISTKTNGEIFSKWAQAQQFNRTIVLVMLKNKKYFLDSNNKFCPFGYLSPNLSVDSGFLMQEEKGKIIKIKPLKSKNRMEIVTKGSLNLEGTVQVESAIIFHGKPAIAERNRINSAENLIEVIENKMEDFPVKANIDTFYYSEIDSIDKPLLLTIKYELPSYSEESGNLFYFTPPFLTLIEKNPFEKEKRVFPVDYSYPYEVREKINLDLPDNYTVIEKPKMKKANMPKFNFSKVFFGSDKLECRRNYSRNRTRFSVPEYSDLKRTFDKIVESDQDVVILGKHNSSE